ncbi:DUF2716 domain-containing protein [Amycolatopsis circi]|uniref:DUF2716 domain-containing protein n=1 Tax=Amycolatopsis circi TaxID=871959 RepID=UPI000E222C1F|nr:DUF2716 domain-containing protein [Amycolatopsis circi]
MADEPAWYWVHDKLRFWPSTFAHDWPGFHEPRPSAAWDLSTGEYDRASAEFRLGPYAVEEHDVARAVLAALQETTAEDDWLWVLHWQHQSFKFWPHRMQQNAPWPVSVFPRGDYHLFLAADFSYGTLGHPWERTLCVFGDKLLPAVEKHADGILANQLRRDGQPSALTR